MAGASLYQGSAGIGLFMLEVAHATANRAFRKCAEGALLHAATSSVASDASPSGFAFGRAGIAWVLARCAQLTKSERWKDLAIACLRPLLAEVNVERFDFTHGAAGSIVGLLAVADWLEMSELSEHAVQLGHKLIRRAHHRPVGWSWDSHSPLKVNDLTGLAHGAAGAGYALLELWAATGEAEFRYGAEQAFAYEDRFFDRKRRNWTDFNPRLLEPGQTPPDVFGTAAQPRVTFKNQWCHGAAGIALTRARALDYIGGRGHATRLRLACSDLSAFLNRLSNYSLCHGKFGNCEALLAAGKSLPEPSWQVAVRECVDDALERFGGADARWPSGTWREAPDPTLFLGEAGIGHFILRLTDQTIPSVLILPPQHARRGTWPGLPKPPRSQAQTRREGAVAKLRLLQCEKYFDASIAVASRLAGGRERIHEFIATYRGNAPVRMMERVLRDEARRTSDLYLADALELEACLLRVETSIRDYGKLWIRSHAGDPLPPWREPVDMRLRIGVRFRRLRFDWGHWGSAMPSRLPRRAKSPDVVVYPGYDGAHWMPITRWERRVLGWLTTRRSYSSLRRRLSASTPTSGAGQFTTRRLRRLLVTALDVGIVEIHSNQ